ncbi:MAG: hypothetical protein KF775_18675 [Cyclobacteriaceae bacterium]|nr:hypothetical protein [Cyclobacteriaceae bacterium]
METNWSKLRPLSKLDQLGETIIKTAFILSQDHNVITSYLNHYGANFKIACLKRGGEFEVLCRQICVDRTTYSFIPHKGLRSNLLIGLVMFIDGQKPVKYLFPSTVWQTPNQLFTNSSVNHAEYGISVNRKTFAELAEYAFEKQILNY